MPYAVTPKRAATPRLAIREAVRSDVETNAFATVCIRLARESVVTANADYDNPISNGFLH
jgi:hypothetical protein